MINLSNRKIIHIDMDCFYAAVEIRDNPSLAHKPVAVGGDPDRRGVLCTCNYIARKFGLHSAMSSAHAFRICPELVLLPVNMDKYKNTAKQIQSIFYEFTDLVEPLSLDEAYLDVSCSPHYDGSATLIAEAIRDRIWQSHKLTASAGVSANKFLAKIASGWNKPNGIFIIKPEAINQFVARLPVNKLFGVGKITASKLQQLNVVTCNDLQHYSLAELSSRFGKLGTTLYYQARGIDNRVVEPNRPRKSLSVEHTFSTNIDDIAQALEILYTIHQELELRLAKSKIYVPIKSQFIKIKFANFKQSTAELQTPQLNFSYWNTLFNSVYSRFKLPIRLLGLGVSFDYSHHHNNQPQLF